MITKHLSVSEFWRYVVRWSYDDNGERGRLARELRQNVGRNDPEQMRRFMTLTDYAQQAKRPLVSDQ